MVLYDKTEVLNLVIIFLFLIFFLAFLPSSLSPSPHILPSSAFITATFKSVYAVAG